jgi:hypothetical protein
MILSRIGVTIRRGFGLDDRIYCVLYIRNSGLQAIATLGFSVFTNRILVTDLLQSHCNFKTHEVFFAQPNSFLAIILQLLTQFNSSTPKLLSWQAGVSKLDSLIY